MITPPKTYKILPGSRQQGFKSYRLKLRVDEIREVIFRQLLKSMRHHIIDKQRIFTH